MTTIGNLIIKIGANVDGLKNGIGQAQGIVSGAKTQFGGLGAVLQGGLVVGATAATAAVAAVGVGLAATGAAAVSVGSQIQQSQNDIQAGLGTTAAEAERLGDIAVTVFRHNFGDSIEGATAVLIEARRQLGELSDQDLQNATENALRLSDVFDVDYADSLNSAKVLMDQFGLTQQQAFDFMASGFQRGLNSSGDFLDSISEYGNLFADAGFGADQFFSLMETGLQGGVLGTDKIADAIKEFGIIAQEGGADVSDAFAALGLDFERISGFVAAGDETWADYFDKILAGLNEIDDPIQRNQIQVALFGTMAEDLGVNFTNGLSDATTSLEDIAGATESLNQKYQNWGAVWEGVKRTALVALAPIGEGLLDLANKAMPVVEEATNNLYDAWSGTAWPAIQSSTTAALEAIAPYLDDVRAVFVDFRDSILPALQEAWQELSAAWTQEIKPALDELWQAAGMASGEFGLWDGVLATLRFTLDAVVLAVKLGTTAIRPYVTVITLAINAVTGFVEGLRSMKRAIDGLGNPFSSLAGRVRDLINTAQSLPSWLIPGSPTPFELGLRGIAGAINAMPKLDFGVSPNLARTGGAISSRQQINDNRQYNINYGDRKPSKGMTDLNTLRAFG